MRYSVAVDGKAFDVEISAGAIGPKCRLNGREISVDFVTLSDGSVSLLINGTSFSITRDSDGGVFVGTQRYEVTAVDPRSWQGRVCESSHTGPQRLTASMPGKIVRILASEGDDIQAGQGIIVVEAMKMQNEIKSPRTGRLQKLMVREGVNVNPGEVLAIVE